MQSHKRDPQLHKGTPTQQKKNAYKVITKGLRNRSPQRNMVMNKVPSQQHHYIKFKIKYNFCTTLNSNSQTSAYS